MGNANDSMRKFSKVSNKRRVNTSSYRSTVTVPPSFGTSSAFDSSSSSHMSGAAVSNSNLNPNSASRFLSTSNTTLSSCANSLDPRDEDTEDPGYSYLPDNAACQDAGVKTHIEQSLTPSLTYTGSLEIDDKIIFNSIDHPLSLFELRGSRGHGDPLAWAFFENTAGKDLFAELDSVLDQESSEYYGQFPNLPEGPNKNLVKDVVSTYDGVFFSPGTDRPLTKTELEEIGTTPEGKRWVPIYMRYFNQDKVDEWNKHYESLESELLYLGVNDELSLDANSVLGLWNHQADGLRYYPSIPQRTHIQEWKAIRCHNAMTFAEGRIIRHHRLSEV